MGVQTIHTPLGVRLTGYCPHYPHAPQEAFLWLDVLDAFYGGAAGGGKSDALLMAALQYVDVPGYSALLMRKTFADLNLAGALIPRSKEWLYPKLGQRAWNEQRTRWTFPSGATLEFGYLQHADDHFRYQGAEYQFIGIDEATHIRPDQFRYMFSRLRRVTDGPLGQVPVRFRAASNPGGMAHEFLKGRYIDQRPMDDEPEEIAAARVFIPARLDDNPSLDRDQYRRSLQALEPEVRKQLLEGDWDARQPGDWYFDDRHLAAVVELGRAYETLLDDIDSFPLAGGAVHLGIDWGESTHALLGFPLETGGWFIAREYVNAGGEPSEKTARMLGLNEWGLPWGRAFFDAAGIQSQKTFNRTRDRLMGTSGPAAKSIPFGAPAARTARTAARSFKGVGCTYLRRLARRASEGSGVQVLAVSPRCPVLLAQLKQLQSNPEDPGGSWLKDDEQHGADAAVALVATSANRFRVAVETDERIAA